jgi:protease-4
MGTSGNGSGGSLASGCLIACLAAIGTCLTLFFMFAFLAGKLISTAEPLISQAAEQKSSREELLSGEEGAAKKIVVIDIKGPILSSAPIDGANSEIIVKQLKQAAEDPDVVAVILDMNTPGGEVIASDEIHHAVQDLRGVHKPVVTCMRSLGASGGYLIAAGTDWILANRMTLTGSIGVRMGALNYAKLFNKIGLESEVFTSGKLKDMLNGGREWTDLERQYVLGMVKETFAEFAAIVAQGRQLGSPAEVMRAPYADGRILSGRQAKELGLVDQLGYFQDAMEKTQALAKAPQAKVVRYRRGFRLADLLMSAQSCFDKGFSASVLPADHRFVQAGRLYYLMDGIGD